MKRSKFRGLGKTEWVNTEVGHLGPNEELVAKEITLVPLLGYLFSQELIAM